MVKELDSKTDSDRFFLEASLNEEDSDLFSEIKRKLGYPKIVDVFRWAIDSLYSELVEGDVIQLDETLEKRLYSFLSYEYLKKKHLVSNINEIIELAVREYFKNLASIDSLHNRDFIEKAVCQKIFNQDDKIVAITLISKQFETTKGLSVSEIASITSLDDKKIKRSLEKFSRYGHVSKINYNGTEFYHVPV
ncbi:MAG: hypothetical protein ACFFD4_35400 [Candidatus Odinarchaeota archaeon]